MDTDAFWHLLATAKGIAKPLDAAVADHLSTLPAEEILAFEHRFFLLRATVHRWDVWAAAHLIGGGCSDDSFRDFTAGLVALGREWYERASVCPDALAEHPAVHAAAAAGDQRVIFDEGFNYVSSLAYERLTGDPDGFWEAWPAYATLTPRARTTVTRTWEGHSTSPTTSRCANGCHGCPRSTSGAHQAACKQPPVAGHSHTGP